MIKAKKGLLIALFAAMMVFAFGATSAFATVTDSNGYVWSDDFSTVTIEKQEYPTTRTIGSDGMVTAIIDTSDYSPAPTFNPQPDAMHFYDLNGTTLNYVSNYSKGVFENTLFGLNNDPPRTTIANAQLAIVAQDYVEGYATMANKTIKPVELKGWTAEIKLPEAYDRTATTDQNVTLEAGLDSTDEADGTVAHPYLINADKATLTKAVKVAGASVVAFYIDEEGVATYLTQWVDTDEPKDKTVNIDPERTAIPYDGTAHKIINTTDPEKTVAYAVLNTKTGNYDAVSECPEVKNVGDEVKVRATVSWTETARNTTTAYNKNYNFTLSVVGRTTGSDAIVPTFGWTAGNGGEHNGAHYVYEVTGEQAANPAAFIEFKNGFSATGTWNKGDESADIETLKEFFNDCYDVTVTQNEIDSELQTWEIAPKVLTATEKSELTKKYKQLIKTYQLGTIGEASALSVVSNNRYQWTSYYYAIPVSVKGQIDPDTKVDEINFTEAPNVTYKAKKIKKKAKSFTVNAVAVSGNVVSYRIDSPSKKITIDSATGKITVAKGLKKGTYNVVVKAQTEKGNGYAAAKAERTIKIKVKK